MSANRCEHIKDNGVRCQSPAMHRRAYCYFHWRLHAHKLPVNAPEYEIPALDSEGGIQLAVAHVLRGIYSGKLDNDTARVALAAIRLAAQSLRMEETIGSCCMVTETTPAMDAHFQCSSEMNRSGAPSSPSGKSGMDVVDITAPQEISNATGAPFLPSVGKSGMDPVDISTAPQEDVRFHQLDPSRKVSYARTVLRSGPTHPEFHDCVRFLDAHISSHSSA